MHSMKTSDSLPLIVTPYDLLNKKMLFIICYLPVKENRCFPKDNDFNMIPFTIG